MFGSRQKGSVAEREVAALMRDWWRALEPDCEFCKTPLSGGWQTPQLRVGFKMTGDLCTTAKHLPWTLEIKRRESWSLDRLLAGKKSPVWSWWRQAQAQGDEASLVPMLWLRKNREPWRIMLPLSYVKHRPIAGCRAILAIDSVDFGTLVPSIMLASDLLAIPPKEFAA